MKRTNRILSLALTVSLMLSLLIVPANAASFTDIRGHWAEILIEQAVAHGYVPAGGTFEPNKAITRNEFARMVNGAFGLTSLADLTFTDVSKTDPYYKDVRKAVFAGYIAGYEDNTFRGTNLITRQEAAAIIARLATHPGTLKNMSALKDASTIAAWAMPAAKIVYTKGYMVGDNLKMFNPLGNLTRAETVKILECTLDTENIVSGTVTIHTKNEVLSDTVYTGNVIISERIGQSSVQLNNCKVLGTLTVNGGGASGVRLSNTGVANMTVDSENTEVGVAAVGDSTVYNTYLKTPAQLVESNLSGMGAGFKNVVIGGNASKVTLSGVTYDKVTLEVPCDLTLTEGTIANLQIEGEGSHIMLADDTNVTDTVIDAAARFTGNGVIARAVINTSNVTFQNQPRTIDNATDMQGVLTYTSTPANGTMKVAANTAITIAFDDAILPASGQTLTNAWVRSNVFLRKNTLSDGAVEYSASISSNGKVLTITPASALEKGCDYLLTVNSGAFKGSSSGLYNAAIAIAFSVDGKASSSSVSNLEPVFYPGDKSDSFSIYGDLTLTFDEKIFDDEGESLTSAYLKNYALELHRHSTSGARVPFSASINTARKVITITPDEALNRNTTYYLIVNKAALTNAVGTANVELVYRFTTGNSHTEELLVDVKTEPSSAEFIINYDYSGYDADNLKMTVFYRKENSTTVWQKVTAAASNVHGTKIINLTGLSKNTEYDFEVEVDLYDGTNYVDADSFTGTFITQKSVSSTSIDNAISSITVSSLNSHSLSSLYLEEYENGVFMGYIDEVITLSSDDILEIKVNTYDSDATVWVESDEDYDIGGDNDWMSIEISNNEWYEGEVFLYITVEDSDGIETFYEIFIYIE